MRNKPLTYQRIAFLAGVSFFLNAMLIQGIGLAYAQPYFHQNPTLYGVISLVSTALFLIACNLGHIAFRTYKHAKKVSKETETQKHEPRGTRNKL